MGIWVDFSTYDFLLLLYVWVCLLDKSLLWVEILTRSSWGVIVYQKTFLQGCRQRASKSMVSCFFFPPFWLPAWPVLGIIGNHWSHWEGGRTGYKMLVGMELYVYWKGRKQKEGECRQQASGAPAGFSLNPSCLSFPFSFPSSEESNP